jgi:hypothetical protein
MSGNKPASSNRRPKPQRKPGRVDLLPDEFQNLIEDQGVKVRITPSGLCPNRATLNGTDHEIGCQVCFGSQVIDFDDDCQEVWAYIQSVVQDKQFNVQGIWDTKDAKMTVQSDFRIYYWYKVEILDFASVFNELIERDTDDTDRLRYFSPTDTEHEYILIDKAGKQYSKGTDFKIIENRKVKWLTANRPIGIYSIVYPILPTFRVLETIHDNRYYYVSAKKKTKIPCNLPQQSVIRWDYLANKSGTREEIDEIE